MDSNLTAGYRKKLADLFSGYRAEWINEDIFNLFTEPSYFPQLTSSHPCFLVGGRGTGKTTALRCLSYHGQVALHGEQCRDVAAWPYFGMYYRVNTNRVRAFDGPELTTSAWTRIFAHYINLEFCEIIIEFLDWYILQYENAPRLTAGALRRVAAALHLETASTQDDLRRELDISKLKFEAAINNFANESDMPPLSLQGAPIDVLVSEVKRLPQFAGKTLFFLIDEYENFSGYQQRVLNTLIKHCGEFYSFKVGIRELGFRERSTLNEAEHLTYPADYMQINITDELANRFEEFATKVCEQRLKQVLGTSVPMPDIRVLLPALSPEEEAKALGVESAVEAVVGELRADDSYGDRFRDWLSEADLLEVFVLSSRAEAEGKTVADKLVEVLANREKWSEHYGNYKYASLFTIKRGKRGIRKYFAGWRVFSLLAASNIRYLLELVDQALNRHLDAGLDLVQPVSAELQTKAAQDTGQRNLRELEGLSLNGAKLTRLLLGLGRVFQVMAEDSIGHTPEVNQFHLTADVDNKDCRKWVEELLTEGIMHLALLRYPGSKLQQRTDIRQFDYLVHPIFSAFFGFSHRRKRKIELSDQDIWNFVERPTDAIREIVVGQNRTMDEELPEQMELFVDFYVESH